jgi:hypothetical protein
MDEDHRLALKLAQEAEAAGGYPPEDQVISRARRYLDFLLDAPPGAEATSSGEPASLDAAPH